MIYTNMEKTKEVYILLCLVDSVYVTLHLLPGLRSISILATLFGNYQVISPDICAEGLRIDQIQN